MEHLRETADLQNPRQVRGLSAGAGHSSASFASTKRNNSCLMWIPLPVLRLGIASLLSTSFSCERISPASEILRLAPGFLKKGAALATAISTQAEVAKPVPWVHPRYRASSEMEIGVQSHRALVYSQLAARRTECSRRAPHKRSTSAALTRNLEKPYQLSGFLRGKHLPQAEHEPTTQL